MIREGIDGSLCFFWKGKLMCSYPKVGNNIDEFFTQNAKNIIEQMIRQQGFTIKQQINHYIDDDLHALDGICFFPPYKKS